MPALTSRLDRAADRAARALFPAGWKALVAIPVAVLLVAKSLAGFAQIVQPYLAIHYDFWFELGMVLGQVAFQWCVLWRRPWRAKLDYAFLLVLVSGLGAALLLPLLGWHRHAPVAPLVGTGYFMAVVAVMFAVHWFMVKAMRLPALLCATWVVYRLLILLVALRRP